MNKRARLPAVSFASLGLLPGCMDAALRAGSTGDERAQPRDELVVWSGEPSHDPGSGWASCENEHEGTCQARLEKQAGAGRDGGTALRFTARGSEWLGFGWNWFGWWPPQAGTDISDRKSFAFAIKVVGEPGMAPEPFTLKVALGGSARDGQDLTDAIAILDHAEGFADGHWHDVSVPISALLRGRGADFDTYRVWSFTIGAWNQGERHYEVFVDDVRFR